MRKFALICPALLAACASAPPAAAPAPGGGVCRSEGLAAFAGRPANSQTGAEILRVTGARILRWVQPGMAVTMEFREDRVTVWLAAGNRIERANCG